VRRKDSRFHIFEPLKVPKNQQTEPKLINKIFVKSNSALSAYLP
jgi:hypothetical protein